MMNKKYASVIKRHRKALEMTQKQLADKAGVTDACISKMEAGETDPQWNNILNVSKVLKISLDELAGRD